MDDQPTRPGATPWFSRLALPALFALLVAGICAGGYLYYLDLEKRIRSDSREGLARIADLKAHQIAQWMAEQLGVAEVIRADRMLSREVRGGSSRDLRAWMEALLQQRRYRSVLLLDAKGMVILGVGDEARALDAAAAQSAAEAMACGCVVFSDLRRDENWAYPAEQSPIRLDLLVPLKGTVSGRERITGVLLLCIDPRITLYPLVQSWPATSASAEIMLVRTDGQDVVFLNELRHQAATALSLRMPTESDELPAALVAQERREAVEGVDYRGKAVLAAGRLIAETPWTMVVQVDLQEILAPLRQEGRMILMACLLLVTLAAVIAFLIWIQKAAHQQAGMRAGQGVADHNREAFIETVAGQMRPRLNETGACVQQLQEAWPDRLEAESRLALDRIRANVLAMDQRLEDLLAFSRMSGCDLAAETIPMADLFQAAYDELRAVEPGRNVRWSPGPMPAAQGDPALIREVVRHLLANAFKYTRNRKPAKIEAGALAAYMGRDGFRTFFVKDNGVGFDMQDAGNLFGLFQQLPGTQAEGSGTGLAIVKQIVERHGGMVWAQSSPDEGAIFFFSLPSRDK